MSAIGSASAASEIGPISAEQAKLVLDVTRMLAVTTDLDALLHHIATAACQILHCERASIFLHDPATNELKTRVALQTMEIRVPSNVGIVGAAFTGNQVLHVPSPYDDPRFNREIDRKTGFTTRNILAAPLMSLERKPLGVVQAINKSGPAFGAVDVAL